jgi:hypothetical protein
MTTTGLACAVLCCAVLYCAVALAFPAGLGKPPGSVRHSPLGCRCWCSVGRACGAAMVASYALTCPPASILCHPLSFHAHSSTASCRMLTVTVMHAVCGLLHTVCGHFEYDACQLEPRRQRRAEQSRAVLSLESPTLPLSSRRCTRVSSLAIPDLHSLTVSSHRGSCSCDDERREASKI